MTFPYLLLVTWSLRSNPSRVKCTAQVGMSYRLYMHRTNPYHGCLSQYGLLWEKQWLSALRFPHLPVPDDYSCLCTWQYLGLGHCEALCINGPLAHLPGLPWFSWPQWIHHPTESTYHHYRKALNKCHPLSQRVALTRGFTVIILSLLQPPDINLLEIPFICDLISMSTMLFIRIFC